MKDKICIITGSSSGIGKETAKALAKMGAHIVMVCRSMERGLIAKNEIEEFSESKKVDLLIADLSSLHQINSLSQKISNNYPHIDILINNAGNFYLSHLYNDEGIEMSFAVNYLAPFYLSNLLLPKLLLAKQGRIINVTSRNQSFWKIDMDYYDYKYGVYNGLQAYSNAKLMTIIFTQELAKRLRDTNITVNALHPGDVKTSIGMRDNKIIYKTIWLFLRLFNISVEKGAENSIYLATSKELENITGQYFVKNKIAKYNPIADQVGIGNKLWDYTQRIIDKHENL